MDAPPNDQTSARFSSGSTERAKAVTVDSVDLTSRSNLHAGEPGQWFQDLTIPRQQHQQQWQPEATPHRLLNMHDPADLENVAKKHAGPYSICSNFLQGRHCLGWTRLTSFLAVHISKVAIEFCVHTPICTK